METVDATAGVGIEGQSLQDPDVNQTIAQPAITFFAVKQRVVFEIQLPQALNLYKATNDGKGPQSLEELMDKVVTPNGFKLPELPPGHTYEWDAEQQKLMVKRPAAGN